MIPMENNENKSFKDKLLGAFASFETAVTKEVDKMKEDYNYDKYFVENALIMVPGDTSKGENKNIAGTQFDSAVTGWN